MAPAVLLMLINGCAQQNNQQSDIAPEGLGEEEGALPTDEANQVSSTEGADAQVAVIETEKGTFKFKMFPNEAPKTVANFVKLAGDGFYDGTKFHRVEPNFVIQGGDPNSKDDDPLNDGQGGPGYTIDAEFNEHKHLRGTVAMARKGNDVNSAGSQFYVTLEPQPSLDGQYTVFGQLTEGIEVIDKVAKGDLIKKITIEPLP